MIKTSIQGPSYLRKKVLAIDNILKSVVSWTLASFYARPVFDLFGKKILIVFTFSWHILPFTPQFNYKFHMERGKTLS